MTPISTIRLEQNLRERTRGKAAKRTTTTKLRKGQRRAHPVQAKADAVKAVQTKAQAKEAKNLIESAVPKSKGDKIARDVKKRSGERPVPTLEKGKKPTAADMKLIPERDVPSYANGVGDVKCPRCGSGKGIPCVHPGGRMGFAHGARKAAAKKTK